MTTLPHTLTTLIEIALNRYLNMDPEIKSSIRVMSGRVIRITIRELDAPIIVQIGENRINVLPGWDDAVDSEMLTSAITLMKLGMARDAGASALSSGIEMSGDLETGRQFRDLLARVDIDWEEILSQYTGDIIAHKVGNSVRTIANWGRNTADALQKNVTEYLQEESRQLPSQFEIETFLAGVDEIRLATDRAEARITNLQKIRKEKNSGEALE